MTNYEKIKQMSVDELADWVSSITEICFDKCQGYSGCIDCPFCDIYCCNTMRIRQWLESEEE